MSLKSLPLLYSDVSKAIYFNSATEPTNLYFHFSTVCTKQTTREVEKSGDKMSQRLYSADAHQMTEMLPTKMVEQTYCMQLKL